ncbi:DUF4430 domain-containing protein [Lysinibacillus sp. FSL W8-0992]|uniref:DUF4430 domain-containing protein n=1 Tax=Lysinibacillus sp. FSL W8-0992 TaxID=2954643 RepID=UPI0030FA5DAA
MKIKLPLLLLLVLTIFLTACNIQTVEKFEQMQEQERSVEPKSTTEQHEATEETPSVDEEKQAEMKSGIDENSKNEKQDKPQQEVQQENQEVVEQPKKEAEKKQEVTKAPNTKTEQKATNKTGDKEKTNTVTPPNEVQQQPATQKRTVTIAIRVDTLLKHWDKLDSNLQSEKYVPKNGIILKPTTYELLSEKDTVWDVLQRATKEYKIQMEYQGANENIYNSVYVEGINHLYEFSAGELSGWMYKVNGVYPNYGCSQYVLKDGDVIEWHYTVDLGRDLGNHWDGN